MIDDSDVGYILQYANDYLSNLNESDSPVGLSTTRDDEKETCETLIELCNTINVISSELARVKREMDATYNLLAYMFGCPLNYTTIRHGSVAEYIASPVPENTSDETSWKMFVAAIMRDDNTKEDEE